MLFIITLISGQSQNALIPAGDLFTSSYKISLFLTASSGVFFDSIFLLTNRFSAESKSGRDPMLYLPFGAGPRHCVGSRLSLLEIKVALVTLLNEFTIETTASTQVSFALP